MRKWKIAVLSALAVAVMATSYNAKAESNRSNNRIGFFAGLLGEPFPTIVGLNVGYNLMDFVRLTAGWGSVSGTSINPATLQTEDLTITTIGAGAKLLVPGWNFSPMAGLSWATITLSGNGTLKGFTADGSHMYITGGIDWQAESGFNFGAGVNLSLKSGVSAIPFINLGYFFDWF